MFTKFSVRFIQILSILALIGMVFAQVSPVAAQSAVPPTVSRYSDLPKRGQLILVPGSQFVVPAELDGLVVTIWRGMADSTVQPVIEHSNSIAGDRADRYGGVPSDFVTVIWDKNVHPLPGFSTRQPCDDAYGHDAAVLNAGTSIGDAGCYEMIEYDRSEQPDFAVVPAATEAVAPASTPVPTIASTQVVAPAPVESSPVAPAATPQAVQPTTTPDPLVIPINGSVNKLNLMGFAIIALLIAVLFSIFRGSIPSGKSRKGKTRRSTTKKKSTEK